MRGPYTVISYIKLSNWGVDNCDCTHRRKQIDSEDEVFATENGKFCHKIGRKKSENKNV